MNRLYKIQALALLITSIMVSSCNFKGDSINIAELTQNDLDHAAILASLQGNFVDCSADPVNIGYYLKMDITVSGTSYTAIKSMSNQSNCSSPYWFEKKSYTISRASYEDVNQELLNIDFKFVEWEVLPNFAWAAAYCSESQTLGQYNILTGKYCNASYLATDAFHTNLTSKGDDVHIQLNLAAGVLSTPVWYAESGDSPAERKTSNKISAIKQ